MFTTNIYECHFPSHTSHQVSFSFSFPYKRDGSACMFIVVGGGSLKRHMVKVSMWGKY